MWPVLSFPEPFVGEGVLLQLHRIIVVDLEGGDTDIPSRRSCFPEDSYDVFQGLLVMKKGIVIQKYQDWGFALPDSIIPSPGDAQVLRSGIITEREVRMPGNKGLQ